jgi:hypothetical protein
MCASHLGHSESVKLLLQRNDIDITIRNPEVSEDELSMMFNAIFLSYVSSFGRQQKR